MSPTKDRQGSDKSTNATGKKSKEFTDEARSPLAHWFVRVVSE
jgi:hypothetical protein